MLLDGVAMTNRRNTTGPTLVISDPGRLISEVDGSLDIGPLLQELLARHSLHVIEVRELEHGWQLRMREGPIINIYYSGKVQKPQGQRPHLASKFVEELQAVIDELRHGRRRRLIGPP
jgi:hypothetical protein